MVVSNSMNLIPLWNMQIDIAQEKALCPNYRSRFCWSSLYKFQSESIPKEREEDAKNQFLLHVRHVRRFGESVERQKETSRFFGQSATNDLSAACFIIPFSCSENLDFEMIIQRFRSFAEKPRSLLEGEIKHERESDVARLIDPIGS